MKILILANEVWSDYIFGNGVLTNWFTDFDAEFAQIYLSPGLPNNNICCRYFQVDDKQMLKSFVGKRAGRIVEQDRSMQKMTTMHQGIYKYLKKISTYIHTPMMMIQDFIWCFGRYDVDGMKKFIDDFNPDVIFSPRMGSIKIFRIEKLLSKISNVPIIAFTGDNEIGYDCYSYSPLYWLQRYYVTNMFQKNSGIYSHYFMHSQLQANLYNEKFGISTSTLFKCATSFDNKHITTVNDPVVMVYAGRLYCNRWKTLGEIGKALKVINKDREKIKLDIYTSDELTDEQKEYLNTKYSICVHRAVTPNELIYIYNHADIALHVESLDKRNMLATKYSFSTKIIDLLSSGCAVMAICWEQQTGYHYLKSNDAAFCIPNYDGIQPLLQQIVDFPILIKEYARKAQVCAKTNHQRDIIQKQLTDCFNRYIQ